MPHCEWLQPNERDNRRSIADAMDLLHQHAAFEGGHTVKIRIGGLRLPSQHIVGLVAVCAENAAAETAFIVTLPTCKTVWARRLGREDLEEFDIFQLDGATVHGNGNVELVDGTRLRAVELTPSLLPYHVTELEWCIIRHTIAFMGVESECRYLLPSERFCYALDCSALPALQDRAPLLKQIRGYILDQDPALEDLSEQKIADAMCKFGIRIPRTRRTRRLGSTAAA
ncbi:MULTISPECIES: hypothetical protein [Bradyrhizobium]|uniref:Uncharacterized protein n=1 Tax=Bradyrhizobium ottawaense TaxID=931866 RepID=A0ABV4G5G5_9BRAD|nr:MULTISPECIES: hypothetical protein [Bradyrhizobium]MBR1293692.1 hypothetical protein [Bradyrhizobium ottawaense]WLB43911.1 hypothetical protein QIH93_25645 [Bradyrhizobium ottawaense]BBO11217.1 hypothetical protein TM102_26870 [Bradyrhizobium sp. TM102]GMO88576.1 hypothetical protein BwSF19_53750 [Bradyrhizobium ottawaense]